MSKHLEDKKIKKVSAVDLVSNSLKTALINGEYKIGEKLPSEAKLADLYGVNRLTVRMALQKLNTLGMVETKVGEGTYVKDFTFTTYLNEISDIYLNTTKLNEVRALRKLIELESAKMVIQNGSDDDINEIEKKLQEYIDARNEYKKSGMNSSHLLDWVFEKDLDLHCEICKQSKNSLFHDLFSFLRPLIKKHLSEVMKLRMNDPEYIKIYESYDEHILLVDSIKRRDWKKCKSIYLSIIDYHNID